MARLLLTRWTRSFFLRRAISFMRDATMSFLRLLYLVPDLRVDHFVTGPHRIQLYWWLLLAIRPHSHVLKLLPRRSPAPVVRGALFRAALARLDTLTHSVMQFAVARGVRALLKVFAFERLTMMTSTATSMTNEWKGMNKKEWKVLFKNSLKCNF